MEEATMSVAGSTESDSCQNERTEEINPTITDAVSKLKTPPDLIEYFELVYEAKDRSEFNRLKCLLEGCGTVIKHNVKRGFHNCRKHLKEVHCVLHTNQTGLKSTPVNGDDGPATAESITSSKSLRVRQKKHHKRTGKGCFSPDISAPSPRMQLRTRNDRVRVHRLDTSPDNCSSRSPKKSKIETETYELEKRLLCYICGKTPDERTLAKQQTALNRQKKNHSNAICRLLKIPEPQFLDFFHDGKYCKGCWGNIKEISEAYAVIDKLEKQILDWTDLFEILLRENCKNVVARTHSTTKVSRGKGIVDKISEHDLVKMLGNLMEELGKQNSIDLNLTQPTKSFKSEFEIFCSTNLVEEENPMNQMKYEPPEMEGSEWYSSTETGGNMASNENVQVIEKLGVKFRCCIADCAQIFETEETRTRHIESNHGTSLNPCLNRVIKLKCDKCDAIGLDTVFSNRIGLRNHRARDDLHPCFINGVWTCDICSKKLSDPSSIKMHRQKHAQFDLTESNCAICAFKCASEEELLIHNLLHQTETPFMCVLCQLVLSSSVDLKRHMILTHPDAVGVAKRSKCQFPGCDKTFKNAGDRDKHELLRHRGAIGFKCPECDTICASKSQLERHKLTHTAGENLKCDICGVVQKYRTSYDRHMKRHLIRESNGKFKFECKMCPKSFETKQRLMRHEGTHSGVRDKLCDICGGSFTVQNNLNKHYKTHFKDLYPPVVPKKPRPSRSKKNKQNNVGASKPQVVQFSNDETVAEVDISNEILPHSTEEVPASSFPPQARDHYNSAWGNL